MGALLNSVVPALLPVSVRIKALPPLTLVLMIALTVGGTDVLLSCPLPQMNRTHTHGLPYLPPEAENGFDSPGLHGGCLSILILAEDNKC